jgi:hypothetical protein
MDRSAISLQEGGTVRRRVALVDCDRERHRSDPRLVGPVKISATAYDGIAVECTNLAKSTIHVGKMIGLVVIG